jgi:hypothetical protein
MHAYHATVYSCRAQLNFQILAAFPVVLIVTWFIRNALGFLLRTHGVYPPGLLREFRTEMRYVRV